MNKHERICEQLDAYIEDEIKAVEDYQIFKHDFLDTYPASIINSLKIDEAKHKNLLREIKAKVC